MRFGIQLFPPCTAPEMAAYAEASDGAIRFRQSLGARSSDLRKCLRHLGRDHRPNRRPRRHLGGTALQPDAGRSGLELRRAGASGRRARRHRRHRRWVAVVQHDPQAQPGRHDARDDPLSARNVRRDGKSPLGDFPRSRNFFASTRWREAFLRLPPAKSPEIFVAAAGPQMLELAWKIGDGLIVSNLSFPTALVRLGALDLAMTEARASAPRAQRRTPVSPRCCTCTSRYRATERRRNAAPSAWAPAR